jgi:hypothetical protein
MLTRFRFGRPSHATVVAYLALLIALGGSAYATVKLGKGAVKARNIAANAISSPKVKNGSLLARDFRPSQLPSGTEGPPGPTASASDTENPSSDPTLSKTAETTYLQATITTAFQSRIVATATADLYTSGNPPAQASCRLMIDNPSVAMSQLAWSDFPTTGGEDEETPVTGAAVRPPGTYTVSLVCKDEAPGGLTPDYFDRGDLTVIASAP